MGVLVRRRAVVRGAAISVWLVAGFAGVASAQTAVEDQYAARDDEIPALRARVEGQEAQARGDSARARDGELGEQTRSLKKELAMQRETFEAAKASYEEKARATYKGGDLEGLSNLLGGMLGSTEGLASVADPRLAGILLEGRESLEAYRRSEVTLQNTSRQISQKKRDYEDALQEEKAQTGELRSREQDLREVIAAISSRKARTESRLRELRAAERARILEQKAATAAGGTQLGYEIGIARDDIVSEAVEPISNSAYRKLYRESARQYGFGEDWYILAAVGKVESDHGANMGPSSAGAMGPMQFLPSTWETAGVDGNGDGV